MLVLGRLLRCYQVNANLKTHHPPTMPKQKKQQQRILPNLDFAWRVGGWTKNTQMLMILLMAEIRLTS